jgi:hypothetical protein
MRPSKLGNLTINGVLAVALVRGACHALAEQVVSADNASHAGVGGQSTRRAC